MECCHKQCQCCCWWAIKSNNNLHLLTIDIWTRRRWRTSMWFYVLRCHPPKLAGFQWNCCQKFSTLLWTPLPRRKMLSENYATHAVRAKSAKNDHGFFYNVTFILKQREYVRCSVLSRCPHKSKCAATFDSWSITCTLHYSWVIYNQIIQSWVIVNRENYTKWTIIQLSGDWVGCESRNGHQNNMCLKRLGYLFKM